MSEHRLAFGVLKTNRGVDNILEVDITERIDLGKLSPSMRSNLKKAIRNGVAPVEYATSGKLACLYAVMCQYIGVPQAYLSKQAKGLLVQDVSSEDFFMEMQAMHMLTKTSYSSMLHRGYENTVRDYRTALTYQSLVGLITKYRPIPEEKLNKALNAIDSKETLTIKCTTIRTRG